MNIKKFAVAFCVIALAACRQTTIVDVKDRDGNGSGNNGGSTTTSVDSIGISPSVNISLKSAGANCVATSSDITARAFPRTTSQVFTFSAADGVASVIAKSDTTATITGLKPGTETITVRHSGTGRSTAVHVTVSACDNGGGGNTNVTVSLFPAGDVSLIVGQVAYYHPCAMVSPSSETQVLTWTSSNPAVASVTMNNSNCVTNLGADIKPLTPGTTTVCAVWSSTVKACIVVTVNSPVSTGNFATISYAPAGGTYMLGTKLNLVATCTGTFNGFACKPWWYSSDPSTWAVNPTTGQLVNISKGSALICIQWDLYTVDPRFCKTFSN